jgi:hypothetical protein
VVLPRLLRVASFRLTALYIVIFAVSTLIIGATVVLWARSALKQQITARVEAELSLLAKEYRGHGVAGLVQAVNERAQRARTFEYLVESPSSVRLAGNIPVVAALKPGWP